MRRPDAIERLAALLREAQGKRFRWGRWDCCIFSARVHEAVTGEDPRRLFPKYHTRKEAEAIIADCGGMRGLICRALGEPVHVSRANRGDIVLCDFGRGEQPAVAYGVHCFAPGRLGLMKRPLALATAAWKI
jgi:hypothetical protein